MSASKLNTILADPALRAKLEKRFWSKVDRRGPDECWPWTSKAVLSTLKYGALNLNGIVTGSHRVAYAIANGSIPDDLLVRHSCDNPPCCNPKHLIAGTQADNVQDMITRGRNYTGAMTPDRISRANQTRRANRASGKHHASEHQKQIAREELKRRWADPEWRKRWSENMSGENNPTFGRTFQHTDEARRKIAAANVGRKHTEEAKAKMRAMALGRPSAKKGTKVSEETREKMRAAAARRKTKRQQPIE